MTVRSALADKLLETMVGSAMAEEMHRQRAQPQPVLSQGLAVHDACGVVK
jgi:hypothetical protein